MSGSERKTAGHGRYVNAIVYASGLLEPKDFLRVGIPLWLAANVLLMLLVFIYWTVRGFGGLPAF